MDSLTMLPPPVTLENIKVLKKVVLANRHLATLKGSAQCIPNQGVLIRCLSLLEAKDSSEIENIITTHDELYRAGLYEKEVLSPQGKEVQYYAKAAQYGFERVKKDCLLTTNLICQIQAILEKNDAGLRQQYGTVLKNAATGETVYTPPPHIDEINALMQNLEQAINDDGFWPDVDPLIKMAVIHYQFESIHPFYDGNGRTGRILNILYLILKDLLDTPILYLSRYIIAHKGDYYRLLQAVRENNNWEGFVLFMLDAVINTSILTASVVLQIRETMTLYKQKIKTFNFYSKDLVETLFLYPYTCISRVEENLNVSRITATRYLNTLTENGLLRKVTIGRKLYYVNVALFEILMNIPSESDPNAMSIKTGHQ